MNTEQIRRFWKQVDIIHERPDCCWEWKGNLSKSGYGKVTINRNDFRSHRVAYVLKHGGIKEGLCVLHKCDNRKCCNPNHLFLGTIQDNVNDMKQKGRANYAYGENAGPSKLTSKQVNVMRKMHNEGEPIAELVKIFKISYMCVHAVVNNHSHKTA